MSQHSWMYTTGKYNAYCLSVGASLPVVHWEGLSNWEAISDWRGESLLSTILLDGAGWCLSVYGSKMGF